MTEGLMKRVCLPICFTVRPEQKSPTETGASDCCSSDSRPNSRASSIDIRLSGRGNKSGDPVDVDDSDDDRNDFESDAQKGGSATSGSAATTSSPQGTPGSKSGMTVSSQSSNSNINGGASKRKKKTRTVFSRSQVFQLESTFDVKRYLSSSERAGLAASLHLTETQVGELETLCTLFLFSENLLLITIAIHSKTVCFDSQLTHYACNIFPSIYRPFSKYLLLYFYPGKNLVPKPP